MKSCCITLWLFFANSIVMAQAVPERNAFRVGVSRIILDAPDAIGIRYDLQYNRLLAPRFKFGVKSGYLNIQHASILPTRLNSRERVTTDVTLSYDLLKSPVHHIYPGFGLSIWGRNDSIIRQAEYETNSDGTINIKSFRTGGTREVNVGHHFSLEYELRFSPKLSFSAQAGMNNLGRGGQNSNAGLSIGYHF